MVVPQVLCPYGGSGFKAPGLDLAAPGCFWQLLAAIWTYLGYLGLSGSIWASLGLFGPIWAYLGYLGLSGPIWAYLGPSELSWLSELAWAYLGLSDAI